MSGNLLVERNRGRAFEMHPGDGNALSRMRPLSICEGLCFSDSQLKPATLGTCQMILTDERIAGSLSILNGANFSAPAGQIGGLPPMSVINFETRPTER
jgi:hypothetical protein